MRRLMPLLLLLPGSTAQAQAGVQPYVPPFGSNPVFNEASAAAPGHDYLCRLAP